MIFQFFRASLHESGLSFNPERYLLKIQSVFTWEIELRIVSRSRRLEISFRIETRLRFMYRASYFFGDFSTYTFNYVNKTSHFVNNLYFGHNERRFHSTVKSRCMFTWFQFNCNLIRIHVNTLLDNLNMAVTAFSDGLLEPSLWKTLDHSMKSKRTIL